MSHKFINLCFIMASGAKLSAMVPQCLGHGAMPCRPWCRIVLAMVPCLVAMVPQFCDLSAMFTGHGARVFFGQVSCFIGHGATVSCQSAILYRPWCRSVFSLVIGPGHGAALFGPWCHA